MVLGTHKQTSTLLIQQQSFVAAGPFQPEGPEAMPGLELCGMGMLLRIHPPSYKLPLGPACCLSHRPKLCVTWPTHV